MCNDLAGVVAIAVGKQVDVILPEATALTSLAETAGLHAGSNRPVAIRHAASFHCEEAATSGAKAEYKKAVAGWLWRRGTAKDLHRFMAKLIVPGSVPLYSP